MNAVVGLFFTAKALGRKGFGVIGVIVVGLNSSQSNNSSLFYICVSCGSNWSDSLLKY